MFIYINGDVAAQGVSGDVEPDETTVTLTLILSVTLDANPNRNAGGTHRDMVS